MSRSIPAELIASLQMARGFDEKAFLAVHDSGERVTSIRYNRQKLLAAPNVYPCIEEMEGGVPWSSSGYYLSQRPSFTADPLFHAGTYYVQEASSMFLEEALKQTCDLSAQLKVLDLCAAPGGKSTLIQATISPQSLLVSNELIKTRVKILAENISKWGAANVVVTNNDAKDFQRLPDYFDVMVVDAPCSGSGLFRKDPSAIDEWSSDSVKLCSLRQQRILADVLPALKPGGILIYATCSFSAEEDEMICDWLLDDEKVSSIPLHVEPEWKIVQTNSSKNNGYGYRFYPDKIKGEGFFIAAFQKRKDAGRSKEINLKNKPVLPGRQEKTLLYSLIKNADSLAFFKWQNEILAVPESLLNEVFVLQNALYLKKAGVKIGSIIRNELLPDHELALSGLITGHFLMVDTDCPTALNYLRRAELNITIKHTGWTLIKYSGIALGWIKILPNRINNYYPKEWRILNK